MPGNRLLLMKGPAMKRASFLERFRFSYTNALLRDAFRSLRGRFDRHRKLQGSSGTPAMKLNRSKMI